MKPGHIVASEGTATHVVVHSLNTDSMNSKRSSKAQTNHDDASHVGSKVEATRDVALTKISIHLPHD